MPCCLITLTWKMAIVTCTIIMIICIIIDSSYNYSLEWSVYYLCHHHHVHNHTQEMSVGLWVLTRIVVTCIHNFSAGGETSVCVIKAKVLIIIQNIKFNLMFIDVRMMLPLNFC